MTPSDQGNSPRVVVRTVFIDTVLGVQVVADPDYGHVLRLDYTYDGGGRVGSVEFDRELAGALVTAVNQAYGFLCGREPE